MSQKLQDLINSITEGKQTFHTFTFDEVAQWQVKLRAAMQQDEAPKALAVPADETPEPFPSAPSEEDREGYGGAVS